MKTNHSAVQATASTMQINQSVIQTPINPVFVECLAQLREVWRKIFEICEDKSNPVHDCLIEQLPRFEDNINEAAYNIGEMARVDFLEHAYFSALIREKSPVNSITVYNS